MSFHGPPLCSFGRYRLQNVGWAATVFYNLCLVYINTNSLCSMLFLGRAIRPTQKKRPHHPQQARTIYNHDKRSPMSTPICRSGS